MIDQELLNHRNQQWQARLLKDDKLAKRWDDLLFSLFSADERTIKPMLKKVKRLDLYDGFLVLIHFGARGELKLSAEVPEHAQSMVSMAMLMASSEAPLGHPLQQLLVSSKLDRLLLWSFEQIQWNLVPEWAQERLYAAALSMAPIEGGRYQIGGAAGDELPRYSLYVDSFEILMYPVLQLTYEATMHRNPSVYVGASRPVDSVSWYEAVRFCNNLSRNHGLQPAYKIPFGEDPEITWNKKASGFRLLTEAEWEIAARGGEEFQYAGSSRLADVAWFRGLGAPESHCVARRRPNGYGLYDMSGNVFEWCWDWFGSYPKMGVKNYAGPAEGWRRVRRGGSWKSLEEGCTVSFRSERFSHYTSDNLGFRICRSLS